MRIGIDLGGTKIEGIALDEGSRTLWRERVPTPRDDYDATLRAIATLVDRIEGDLAGRGSVGIGIPGAISPATGLVKNANSTWLNGRPLAADLERLLGRPLRFENDANCFTLSEATDGAAAGAGIVFGAILGTGTGGGIAIGGRVLTGANAIAGEWGHNPMPVRRPDHEEPEGPSEGTKTSLADEWPGPPCYCGRRGCIETFLSGPGLARDHAAAAGGAADAAEIVRRADAGDAIARASLARYTERLARALGTIINIIDPEVIVLGGGLSNIESLYQDVPRIWSAYVFSDRVTTTLVRAAHGDSSGVRGAAWLW